MRSGIVVLAGLIWPGADLLCAAGEGGSGGSWPMVRHDRERSARTACALPGKLTRHWVHEPRQGPRPAWPSPALRNISAGSDVLQPSHIYDRVFRVVGAAGRLYYGSSAEDCVVCLEAESGRELWRHVTEGPVRLAPTLHRGRLYAGSDDGSMSCLDAESGRLLWRTRAAPGDRRLPGNGRMISRWPVRAGTIVEDGVVYFTAGLFPSEGVYVCALRADDGALLWRKPAPVAPQGYMSASVDRLYLPAGRTPFHQVDRENGETIRKYGRSNSWGLNLVGGSFASLTGNLLTTGPSEDGQIHLFDVDGSKPLLRLPGRQVIVTEKCVHILDQRRVNSYNLVDCIGKRGLLPVRWHCDVAGASTMVMAGGTLYVAAAEGVVAIAGDDGRKLWSAPVEGRPGGLAACDGRLLVSTEDGKIHCFAEEAKAGGVGAIARTDASLQGGALLATGALVAGNEISAAGRQLTRILKQAGPLGKGIALVLGLDAPDLVRSLIEHTEMRVIAVDPDVGRVERARRIWPPGGRLAVHAIDPLPLPYPDKFANLVVVGPECSERPLLLGSVDRLLRPYGGMLIWQGEGDAGGGKLLKFRSGSPPGAGEWTHFYADAGNSACSHDEIRPGPVELQWFGQPGPRRMIDRHWKTVAPLSKNGRLFVSGNDYIAVLDAFNGTLLWNREMPGSVRTISFKNCSNMVLGEDTLYVAAGEVCERLGVVCGEPQGRLKMPTPHPGGEHEWGYLALSGGYLVGSVSRSGASYRGQTKALNPVIWGNHQAVVTSTALFAYPEGAESPSSCWTYEPASGVIINPTIGISGDQVFFVESGNPASREDPDGRLPLADLLAPTADLVALDLRSGAVNWRQTVDLSCMHHILYLCATEETLLLTGTRYVDLRIRYELKAYAADNGELFWENQQKPDDDHVMNGGHGEQVQHPAIVNDTVYGPGFACSLSTGEAHPGWLWHKSQKCTTVSLSQHCAYSRFNRAKNPYQFDLKTGEELRLTSITRPGCFINIIPAAGMILIPDQSAGCTCEYPLQTSLALVPVTGAHPKPEGLALPPP